MKTVLLYTLSLVILLLCLTGCGNVTLRGEAMIAAEGSAMMAYQAAQRADVDITVPSWDKEYLLENYKQWRYFVQSAKKDLTWGPKLEGE